MNSQPRHRDPLSLPSEDHLCSDSPDGIELCPDCDRRAEEEGMAEMRAEEKERLRELGMD